MKLSAYVPTLTTDATPDPVNDALYVVTAGGGTQVSPNKLVGSTQTVTPAGGIAAAGTNQATATVLTKQRNVVTSAPANTGVALTFTAAGIPQIVINRTGVSFLVYPPIGGTAQIEGAGTNNPVTLPAGDSVTYFPESATQWWTH